MARLPVVFLPGICASFNPLVLLDMRGPTLSGWDFPPFINYGEQFLKEFTSAGYVRNKTLFVAFYDWRKPVKLSAETYLMPWIDRALKASGEKKVVLVAHSMGGLVARSYLVSSQYENRDDVEELITMGTPHRGTPKAYYTWGGGQLVWDPPVDDVLKIYIGYLALRHSAQTGGDFLTTIRRLALGLRDLLPVDDYLIEQGPPPRLKPEDLMIERNLWGDILNQEANLATMFRRVRAVTTLNSTGFDTQIGIQVGPPPVPPGVPARFPDGQPVVSNNSLNGDSTVPLSSAQFAKPSDPPDPRVRSVMTSEPIIHSQLADQAAKQIRELIEGTFDPAAPHAPAPASPVEPRLLILTASPVDVTVLPPGTADAGAGALMDADDEAPQPRRRQLPGIRTFRYRYRDEQLSLTVVTQPSTEPYRVMLHGTASGTYALGALVVGMQGTATPGESQPHALDDSLAEGAVTTSDPQAALSEINNQMVRGPVAEETQLYYQVQWSSAAATPTIQLDRDATTRNAVERLRMALPSTARGAIEEVIAAAIQPPDNLLVGAAPETVRDTVSRALFDEDETAVTAIAAAPAAGASDVLPVLSQLVEQEVGSRNPTLALGLLEQLKQVMAASS